MMDNNIILLCSSALLMGFLGSIHCIAMCGGIVCSLCHACQHPTQTRWNYLSYQLIFNLGRIITYTLLGALTGFMGVLINRNFGIPHAYILRYFTSVLAIMVGVYIAGWWNWVQTIERLGKYAWLPISRLVSSFIPVTNKRYAIVLGSLWGVLPCGLIYSALLFSLSANSTLVGGAIMFCFGIGTLPALILVGSSLQFLRLFSKKRGLRQLAGILMIVFGLAPLSMTLIPGEDHQCHRAAKN